MLMLRTGRIWNVWPVAVAAFGVTVAADRIIAAEPAAEALTAATASSQWGAGYGALAAADTIAGENGNYWQTLQGKDKGAWWQADLGEVTEVRGIKIAWARYQDKVHCPPARAIVQLSRTGRDGTWTDALSIAADRIPRDGSPYEAARWWEYPLDRPTPARYVRLLFPVGGQAGAKHVGYLCLGEVEVQAPGLVARLVNLEGRFGKVELNVTRPSLASFYLRGEAGLAPQSLLAVQGKHPWARGGYSYVVADGGKRYESCVIRPEKVEISGEGTNRLVKLLGVKLSSRTDESPVALEDWTLENSADGTVLAWKIVRRWQRDCTTVLSASPGLFFSFDARHRQNSTTSTIWYDPLRIAAGPSKLYDLNPLPGRISENHLQTFRDRDGWAICKLWTNWQSPADLRVEVTGGHLYRRGSFALLSEVGAVTSPDTHQIHRAGDTEQVTLRIGRVEKIQTGYQLAIRLPDEKTSASLAQFYDAVLNGGAVNDQKGFDFGNESDGWYYAGSCWMYGAAMAAGVPAPGAISAQPYSAAEAFREHLAHVLSTLDEQGRAHFGYNQGGQWVDDNLHTIQGARWYLIHSGDLAFIRQCLPAMERMLGYFVQRRNRQGLFQLEDVGAHWYYDAITTSGVNGYYNAFFYKAASDLAEMEHAAGRESTAREYRDLARSVQEAFNRLLWKEDAPGGARYLDWIDAQGKPVSYFCDLCQWPPIAVGIASAEQARKIVATADARIAELEKQHGYGGYAGLSALWPVPQHLNPIAWQTFGRYMNGGSLLCQTYWEIVARARAGDAAGATRRLKRFAQRAAEIAWAGDNAADIQGRMQFGDGEPYLADMVSASAAAIHGVLGIDPAWDRFAASPCLPQEWPHAEADVLYKGRRHHVVVNGGKVQVQPGPQVLQMPPMWLMDFNLRKTAYAMAAAENLQYLGFYGDKVTLTANSKMGKYTSPVHDWMEPTALDHVEVATDLNAGRVTAIVETSGDGFKTAHARGRFPLQDGVHSYPLDQQQSPEGTIRVTFLLEAPQGDGSAPVIDGFRVVGRAATQPDSSRIKP